MNLSAPTVVTVVIVVIVVCPQTGFPTRKNTDPYASAIPPSPPSCYPSKVRWNASLRWAFRRYDGTHLLVQHEPWTFL